jgi:hypothetical protein
MLRAVEALFGYNRDRLLIDAIATRQAFERAMLLLQETRAQLRLAQQRASAAEERASAAERTIAGLRDRIVSLLPPSTRADLESPLLSGVEASDTLAATADPDKILMVSCCLKLQCSLLLAATMTLSCGLIPSAVVAHNIQSFCNSPDQVPHG